jgi:hypothetical protein
MVNEFDPFERLNTIEKFDAVIELIQSLTFLIFSIATVTMLGFDCNTAYFFLMTANKLTDLGAITSKTLAKNQT